MIEKLLIRNFRKWNSLELPLNDDVNILVGDNDTGKSTILQAIEMVLTGRVGGRAIEQEIAPHWISEVRTGLLRGSQCGSLGGTSRNRD